MARAPSSGDDAAKPKSGQPTRGRPRAADRAPVGIQSVDIALDVLTQILAQPAGIGLSELARATRLQPSKLHRYLVSFARHGLVRQSAATGLYDLGPFARRIGAVAFNRYHGMSVVQEAVADLALRTGCAVCLYVWTELGPTLLRMEVGIHALPVVLREGTALPVCGSGTGRVFLTYLPAAATKGFVAAERKLAEEDDLRVWSDADLTEEARKIRAGPVYWTGEAILPGAIAVAPVFDAGGDLHAVLAVIPGRGQNKEAERGKLVQLIASTVASLSGELTRTTPEDGGMILETSERRTKKR
jgi:DNA-binding IclR family transcriptional regulator